MPALPNSLPPIAQTYVDSAGGLFKDALTPTVRLGVTGLARSGKTVFITALVRNLVSGGRLPFFGPAADGRLIGATLEPQPDDAIPRFDYEAHLAALGRDPPEWPESTRRISQLRVALTYKPEHPIRRALGLSRLNVDIVDYPGEWLADLALLNQSYASWSAATVAAAERSDRSVLSKAWLEFARALDPAQRDGEPAAIRGAEIYTRYLEAVKRTGNGSALLTPGRFLMPGDQAGAPVLTFFPLPGLNDREPAARSSLGALLESRFEKYKKDIVTPFFKNHFAKLDRQIVLVDVLGALSAGGPAISELEATLAEVLAPFNTGRSNWWHRLFSHKIDRVLVAATKADHLNPVSYDRLEAILKVLTARATAKAQASGADVRVTALAALRATRAAEARDGDALLPCIAGVPLPGETIDSTTFDGRREAVIFPGDLPADPVAALEQARSGKAIERASVVRFRPPRIAESGAVGEAPPLPHIRLDRALDTLIGDWLR